MPGPTFAPSRPVFLAVVATMTLVVAGCAADDGATTATASPSAAATPSAAQTGEVTAAAAQPDGSSSMTGPVSTATAAVSGPASPSPSGALQAAVVSQIRAADQGTFDRVVVEFQGTFGAWRVDYQKAITEDPSDRPVALKGQAFLHVAIQNATFDNAFQVGGGVPAAAYAGPRRIAPELRTVQEIADAGDFEAVLSLGIGLRNQAGFRAYRLEGPSRLVIDISH